MSGAPTECQVCARKFSSGRDTDSALVEAQGEQWISCRDNAYWKLNFHMKAEHPKEGFRCPRRGEAGGLHYQGDTLNWWNKRDGHDACSYCGSMSPAEFFAAIEQGCEIGPTDKSYKVYVDLPNPKQGQPTQTGSRSGPAFDRDGKRTLDDLTTEEIEAGRYERPIMGTHGFSIHAKFYFQHLSEDERKRFVDLVNAGKVKIGMPGHFYVMPFFMARATPPAQDNG